MQDLSGRKLGNYELRERLGRGGMAEVYKAYQPGMDRFVAVKVMLGYLANDDNFVERFKREAQAVGKLRHPHIVQIFDFGIEGDVYYMAMEFLQSGTLKEYILSKKKLPTDETLRIMQQLSDALDYAHQAGMIHRDLKPANVMFSDKSYQQAILTDFGIARILGATGLTGTGMSVGTPSYMSPEAGRGEPTDERADIYAMGIIFYEMLTGQTPYDADTPLAVIMKHINAPLPTRKDYGDDVPEAVERIILKCMAKDPDDRFQTAGELTQAVVRAISAMEHQAVTELAPSRDAGTVVSASQATASEEVSNADKPTEYLPQARQGKFNPLLAIGAIVVVAIIAIGAFMALNKGDDEALATPAETEAVAAVTEAVQVTETPLTIDEAQATETPDESSTAAMQAVGDLMMIPPHPNNLNLMTGISPIMDEVDGLFLAGQRDTAIEILNSLLAENPENIEALFARSELFALDWDEGNIAGQDAERIIELEPDNALGYLALYDSWLNYPDQDPEQARAALQRAYELDPENPHIIWRLGTLDEDWELAMQRTLMAEEIGASGFRFIYRMGEFFYYGQNYPRALPYLEISALQGNPDYYYTHESFWMLLGSMIHSNQAQGALDILLQSGRIEAATEPDVFVNGAYVAYRAGNYELAHEWAETARALSDEAYGATYLLGLMAWWVDGDFDAAMNLLHSLEEIEMWTIYLNWELGHGLNLDRARISADAGYFEEALAFYDSAIENHDYDDWLYEERANVQLELGNVDEAREDLQRAFEITEDADYRSHLRERLVELVPSRSND